MKEASELFKTYGIKSVTMDSLANQLGMSKRTIYEVFSDKDELLDGSSDKNGPETEGIGKKGSG